jgi:hypothetical protein
VEQKRENGGKEGGKSLRIGNKIAAVQCILNFHIVGTCCDKCYRIWNIYTGHLEKSKKDKRNGHNNDYYNDSYILSKKFKDIN